ncbi:MAG: hypothetical protein JW994_03800 [Candidatus Omnitrophica bacterium]|nr:hypothetical protein [Candidatus Omnitrophota bacterium]
MSLYRKMAKSKAIDSFLSYGIVFLFFKFAIDFFSSAFVPVKRIRFFNAIFFLLLMASVLTGFKSAYLGVLLYCGISYIIFKPTRVRKKYSSDILGLFFFGSGKGDLARLTLFICIAVMYVAWALI